ncbi:unnamed protein product [Leptosia nina]|uniref:Uncharacterized protein n=1 Tax=Leptosia nina TaxID=320188 RepID=A0AAV1JZE8_9NEOP
MYVTVIVSYLQVFVGNVFLFKSIISLEVKRYVIEDMTDTADRLDLQRIVNTITRSRERERSFRRADDRAEKIKFLHDLITSKVGSGQLNNWLRSRPPSGNPQIDFEGLVENELKNALALKSSALNDRPVIQKRGRNDFLVMKPHVVDPFVTVVPNNMYYNIEKKCVNWLDDCNLQGIRARLLQRVKSPFK